MSRYKTVLPLSSANAAYLAGLIDGEGTITLTREHRRESRRLVVSISNNELALLQYVQTLVGAGHITNKQTYGERHAPSFTYKITNRQALNLLQAVAPYLHTYKAARALLALKEYIEVTPRNGRYTAELRKAREAFEEKFLSILP